MANKEFNDVQLDVTFSDSDIPSGSGDRPNITSAENIAVSFAKLSKWHTGLVPLGGSAGKILGWSNSGRAQWVDDTKVKQTPVGSTNYRPLLIGYANSATAGFSPTEVSEQSYVTSSIYAQPSSGSIYATTFVGALNGAAAKLGTIDVGNGSRPIYLDDGEPKQCDTPTSGAYWNGVPAVGSNGVMEIGKYIDFHASNTTTMDYDYRITAESQVLHFSPKSSGDATYNLLQLESPDYNQIRFSTSKTGKAYTSTGIVAYPLTTSGQTMLIQSDGNLAIGGGESPRTLYSNSYDNMDTAENETLYLASDSSEIHFITNCQAYSGRKVLKVQDAQLVKSGGMWINARETAPVYANKPNTQDGGYYPAWFAKTKSGGWSMGVLSAQDNLYITYTTDTDYSGGSNTNTYQIQFQNKSGTVALTSDLAGYVPMETVTTDMSADTYFTKTGWVNWNKNAGTSTTNLPTANWGILLTKALPSVQVFIPDNASGLYFRRKADASTAATAWWGITGTAGNTYNLNNFISLSSISATNSGSGNAVTSISYSNGVITATKGNSFLPLSGGTMTGDITFTGLGIPSSYPAKSKGIYWSGGTDSIDMYYNVRSSDAGELIINMRDDANVRTSFAYNGTVVSYIDTNGTYNGNATTSTRSSALYTTGVGSSSTTHAEALQTYFEANKSTIVRNQGLGYYSSSYSNGSFYFGYFLSGYDSNPYGGFFVCHYNTPYYVGILSGSYVQHKLLTNQNYTDCTVTKTGGGASGTWEINITGKAASADILNKNSTAGATTSGVQYVSDGLTIGTADGNAKEGSNASYKLWSYPAGGTATSSTSANIQNLRLYWNTNYFRDIFTSPNNDDIYHRAVYNGSAHPWRLLLDTVNIGGHMGYGYTSKIAYDPHTGRFTSTNTSNAWDQQAWSNMGYTRNVFVTFKAGQTTMHAMIGLDSNPTQDAGYANIDYCWYLRNDGTLQIYESGAVVSVSPNTYSTNDEFRVEYDGHTVRYYHNGALRRWKPRDISGKLYFDSCFYNAGSIYDFEFGTTNVHAALTSTGYSSNSLTYRQSNDDFGGTDGRKGNAGDNYYAHYIIANHGNGETYYHYTLRLPFWGGPQYQRKTGGSTETDSRTKWYDFITEENYSSYALPLSGGTMTGVLTTKGGMFEDAYNGALNMNNSDIYGLNSIYTADPSDGAAEGIHFYRDATHVDTLWMSGGSLLFVPNRELGTSTTAANSQKVARFTANPTSGQIVVTDGTTGGIKSSGYTIAKSVPSNADFTNTWRGIQDNLTSSSNTTESLSAKQGYLLANGSARDSTKVLKTGDTMSGNLTFGSSVGIVQTQNSGSNYTTTIKWWTGGTDPGTYGPEIGQWNTGGDSTYPGRIIIMPYHKSYSSGSGPWGNTAGLCIEYNHVYIDGTELSKVGHTHSQYYDSTQSRTANTVLAAPNGSNGAATFRSLVAADIPTLNYVKTFLNTNYDINQPGYYAVMANKTTENPNIDLPTASQWWHVLSMGWQGTSSDVNNWISQLAIPTYQNKTMGLYWRTNSGSSTALTANDWKRVYCEEKLTPSTTTKTRNILHIYGNTVGNTASELISGTLGVLSYGDAGPQINFSTGATIGGAQDSAIIWTDNDGADPSVTTGVSWHFVSKEPDWNVISKRFHARTAITIGTDKPVANSYNLYVTGNGYFSTGITTSGELITNGSDIKLSTTSSSSDDSSDIIWLYGNGKEKSRLWTDNTYTAAKGPNYRVYKSDGTLLYNGNLPLADGTGASGTWAINASGYSNTVYGIYTGNGGVQAPNYFGKNRVGFLMSNVSITGDTHYKNIMYMDCYSGTDVGGVTALAIDRTEARAWILQSDANRTAWNNTAAIGVFTATPTTGQIVVTDGTTGGVKTTGYTTSSFLSSSTKYAGSDTVGGVANNSYYIGDSTAPSTYKLRYINSNDVTTWTTSSLAATDSIAVIRGNVTDAWTTGHIVTFNVASVGTPFQIGVHDSSELYFYKRYKSGSTWSGWTKMNAGNADSATYVKVIGKNEIRFLNESGQFDYTNPSPFWIGYAWAPGSISGTHLISTYVMGNCLGSGSGDNIATVTAKGFVSKTTSGGAGCTMQYNSSTQSLDFVFS